MHDAGIRIAVASSAKKDELKKYLDIAGITDLVDVTTSSDDVKESKPAPDIFEVAGQARDRRLRCHRDRRHPLRCRGGGQGRHPDDRRALRRVHRSIAAAGRMRRGPPRAGNVAGLLRGFAPRKVDASWRGS